MTPPLKPLAARDRRIDDKLGAFARRLALFLALAVVLVLPLGYASLAYRNLAFHIETQAQVKAGAITDLVSGNPKLWAYQFPRLEDVLANYPAPIDDEAAKVFDTNDAVLASMGKIPGWPLLARSAALYDSGRVVGRVEVAHSLRELMYGVAFAALLGLVFGGAVYAVLLAFPLRALQRMTAALEAEREALRASAAQLREAERIAGIGSWEWTPATGVISWSDGLQLVLRRSSGAPTPTFDTLPRFYTAQSWERLAPAVAAAVEAGTPYELELEMVRADGTNCWTTTRGEAARGRDGAVVKLRGTVHDIDARKRAETDQARLEAQLRESQKMEALGTLAGGVAHDFNNIIAAITGNVELALEDIGPDHPALESLEEIRKASRRAKHLTRQILAFGRRQDLVRKPISLAPVVEESARLLRSTLPAGVRLEVACAADAPLVLADATQIEQVLLNLGGNAWQAMKGQQRPGVIEILLDARSVAGEAQARQQIQCSAGREFLRPGRYACLTVRDNGPGMDAATRARIFEPFFTTKPVGEGTGLGLSVVRGIVLEHEACISLDSAPGKGAVFRVYFPETEFTPAALPGEGPVHDQEQGPRSEGKVKAAMRVARGLGTSLMYLDDDEAMVFLMKRLLERRGYRVSGHTDARAALAAVRAAPDDFDLVVTDYNMPGMSGLEFARALGAIRADLPVVLTSGYISDELRAQAPAAGVRELLYKPNTAEELCESVARLANTLPATTLPV